MNSAPQPPACVRRSGAVRARCVASTGGTLAPCEYRDAFTLLVRHLIARRHLSEASAQSSLRLLDQGQPLRGSALGVLKKSFKALRSAPESADLLQRLPVELLGAVAAGVAGLPREALGWRGTSVRRAVDALRHAFLLRHPRAQPTLLHACHLLLAASSSRALSQRSPELALAAAALVRALIAAHGQPGPVALEARAAEAAASLARAAMVAGDGEGCDGDWALFDEDGEESDGEGEHENEAVVRQPRLQPAPARPPVPPAALASLAAELAAWHSALEGALLRDADAEEAALSAVRLALEEAFPEGLLLLFGSRATRLHLPGSDADILLRLPAPPPPGNARGTAREALYHARRQLTRARLADPRTMLLLPSARVPLLRFAAPSLRCDLCCDAGGDDEAQASSSGPAAADWARTQAALQAALRPLVLELKAIVRTGGLGDPSAGGVGGHALTNMALAYLRLSGGLQGPDALLGCLHFFGHTFDYSSTAISLRGEGALVPLRQAMAEGWPSKSKLHGGAAPLLRLHIQDPLRAGVDVGAPSWNVGAVRTLFRRAFSELVHGGAVPRLMALEAPQQQQEARPAQPRPRRGSVRGREGKGGQGGQGERTFVSRGGRGGGGGAATETR